MVTRRRSTTGVVPSEPFDLGKHRGVGYDEQFMDDPVVVARPDRIKAADGVRTELRKAIGQRESPDRTGVSRSRAQQIKSVRFGLWRCLLVRKHRSGAGRIDLSVANHPRARVTGPVFVDERMR